VSGKLPPRRLRQAWSRVLRTLRANRAECILFAVSLALNLYGMARDLPQVTHPDEPKVVRRALAMGTGDLNPHFFLYPTLWIYLVFLAQAAAVAVGLATGALRDLAHVRTLVFIDPTIFFVPARILAAVFGAGSVLLTVRLGRRVSPSAGVLAGALVCLFGPFVWQAHYATGDVPLLFFVLWSLLLCVREAEGSVPPRRGVWLGPLVAGLAISIKWNGVTVLGGVVAALVWRSRAEGWPASRLVRRLLSASVLAAVALAATSPFAFLDPRALLDGIRELVHGTITVREAQFGSWSYVSLVLREAGPILLAAGLLGWGLALASRRRAQLRPLAWTQLGHAIPCALAIQLSGYKAARFFLLLWPTLALGAAITWERMCGLLDGRPRGVRRLVIAIAALAILAPLARSVWTAERDFAHVSAGAQVTRWIEGHLAPGTRVFVDQASNVALRPDRATVERRMEIWATQTDRKTRQLERAYREYLQTMAPERGYALVPTDSAQLNTWASGSDPERDYADDRLEGVAYVVTRTRLLALAGEGPRDRFYAHVRAGFRGIHGAAAPRGDSVIVLRRIEACKAPGADPPR
jgi:hypothetical protein